MAFEDLSPLIMARMPELRGRVLFNEPLAPLTWFRVGGPAQVLFTPADVEDLAYFLKHLPTEIPVHVMGLGSNTIFRDGGVPGVVIRLGGKAFAHTEVEPGCIVRAGAAVPDMKVARVAAEAGIGGLAFLRGIPGGIGGALRMNAGAHGGETKDHFVSALGVDRLGTIRTFTASDMGFVYRNAAGAPLDVIFVEATFKGVPGDPAAIKAEMEEITAKREASQPIKEKTGGSTFKNPPGNSAWKVIDAAGCRGLIKGGAQVSEMHCNFLINLGDATAADIEGLGEEVRARVKAHSGIDLHWEIKRIGVEG
jgi:UDP-N-acetylmuramate dehydrogenase